MAKVKRATVEPNKIRRAKVLNVKKVRIRTNDTKTAKSRKESTEIVEPLSTFPQKASPSIIRKCCVKLHRVKLPAESSSTSSVEVPQKQKLRKCVVKLFRLAPEALVEKSTIRNDQGVRDKENGSNRINAEETNPKTPNAFKNNMKETRDNPRSRLRGILKLRRKPFKEINAQEMQVETPPVITRERRERLRKLSLTNTARERKINAVPNEKDISRFEPLRNSTLHEFGFINIEKENSENLNNSEIAERINDRVGTSEVLKDTSNDKQSAQTISNDNLAQNLVNKSNLIEQILNDDDKEPETVDQIITEKTHTFFHRPVNASNNKPSIRNQPGRTNKITKPIIRRSNVYDFLSLSQTSDSDSAKKNDPMADVIKKLIDEGKVTVATHKKGTGTLQIKRKIAKKKTIAKTKQLRQQISKKNKKDEDKNTIPSTKDTAPTNHLELDQLENPVIDSTVHSNTKLHNDNSAAGSFSNLARSVLISQAGKTSKAQKRISDQRKLLEVARKFVSTPVNKKLPPLEKTAMPSPIASQPTYLGSASPWRVEDQNLPKVFYFSRNSENLPSFSSDFIPSTPKKQSPVVNTLVRDSFAASSGIPKSPQSNSLHSSLQNNSIGSNMPSLHSSYSSNDSNAENLSPPSTTPHVSDERVDENAAVFNLRQQSNPRRALTYRSPLKPINILEVISLPSWKSPMQDNSKRDDTEINLTPKTNKSKTSNANLFGFEEFIEEGEDEELPNSIGDQYGNQSLRQKLHKLKHFRPKDNELPKLPKHKSTRGIFDDTDAANQRLIKDMLCSTMINPPRCNRDSEFNNQQPILDINNENTTNDLSQLFKDPDPEVTFNEKDPHRTYVRPYKRKRKLRHNFVMFLDSDESGDECNDHDGNDAHRKKKRREDPKVMDELNSYVNDFNKVCQEVDQYNLIVE